MSASRQPAFGPAFSSSAPAPTPASPPPARLRCGRHWLALDRPRVMGVINVTPDSFSDGGLFDSAAKAIAHGRALVDAGADLLDIGGESTRPGSAPVSADQEFARIEPLLRALRDQGVPLSVDTRKPEVMRAALAAGADMINDICGFRSREAVEAVAASSAALCVMHMQGEPSTMQDCPEYRDVVTEVGDFLYARAQELRAAGVADERLVIDPGIGFGKTQEHNIALIRHLDRLMAGGLPVLVGVSRKSLIGHLTGRDVRHRLAGSVAAALAVAARGAAIIRVHDVAETCDALRVWSALAGGEG